MGKRIYNIFFSLHTVSGIVISVGLYIIFFTGSFSFFKDEIEIWEKGENIENRILQKINFDKIINHLDEDYELYGRDFEFNIANTNEITINVGACKDTINTSEKGKNGDYFFLKTTDLSKKSYAENYGLSNFLYRLHFLDPIINPIGRNLAGLIAIFFVFAIVTGIIVHWKKIIPNFYSFNPKVFLKRVWTDAHTALGTIGLPFQFIYGITGAFLILKILVLIPASLVYGDQQKLMDDLLPSYKVDKWEKSSKLKPLNLDGFITTKIAYWKDFNIERVRIVNYGGNNMKYILIGKLDTKNRFVGLGRLECNAYTGEIIFEKNPNEINYSEDILETVYRIHFGNYGGITLKIIYFILGILTCFVIISGVLIWVEARNKKSQTLKQRLYTAKIGHIYMAICLAMFPVTALSFLFIKITHGMFENPKNVIYWVYFTTWGIFTLFYRFKRDNYFTNKNSLLLGAIFGFLVPVVSGITSGNWFWKTYANHQHEIFTIDIFWIVLSSFALLFYVKIKPKVQEQSSFSKNPIDYKNLKALKAKEKINVKLTTMPLKTITENNEIEIPMKTKIVMLWIFLAIGWIVHHLYGVFNIYYNESVMMEGATGETPMIHHIYRIIFEGLCLLFGLLTIEISKKWFIFTSFVFAIIGGLYNVYHLITASIYESSNISELFMLILMVVASAFLIKNLNNCRKLS